MIEIVMKNDYERYKNLLALGHHATEEKTPFLVNGIKYGCATGTSLSV